MKIIHFADLHLGIDTVGKVDSATGLPVRILDTINALDNIVEYVIGNRPDLVIFAGDAYHRNLPTPTQVTLFSERIRRIADICPVVIVIGNHDMFGQANKKTALDLFPAIGTPNVYVGNKPMNLQLQGINLSLLPYPDRSTSQEMFEQQLLDLHGEIEQSDLFSILVAHCSVEGATYGSERTIMGLGHDPILPIDLLRSTRYDYVALGHIHVLQDLGDESSMPIVYSGTPLQLDFGDEDKDTGFIELLIEDSIELNFIPIESRRFHTVRINNQEFDPADLAKDYADSHKDELIGSIVRILIELEDDYPVVVEDIVQYYYAVGCLSVTVKVSRPRITRSIAITSNIASYSPLDLTKLYFKGIGLKKSDTKELLMLAKEIMDEQI